MLYSRRTTLDHPMAHFGAQQPDCPRKKLDGTGLFLFTLSCSVETLEAIAMLLKIKHWDVKRNSCSGGGGLSVLFDIAQPVSNVTCDCTFSNFSVFHVSHINPHALQPAEAPKFDRRTTFRIFKTFLSTGSWKIIS
ncbi:hypothetical protein POM88_013847 [Heracleum sosnowskyi]|uniref:Uncharacterized protein n=1 Tax=Heracleum sosnowskyi TaxID=360622 RepID=A0AAD8J006_9APIA|nr:hypothetical protein POM88_013847 [Heracleum sosnowskyi]